MGYFPANRRVLIIMALVCCLLLRGGRGGWWGAEWQTNRLKRRLGPVIMTMVMTKESKTHQNVKQGYHTLEL